MAWGILILAGLLEMVGVLMIHQFHQRRNIFSVICFILAFGGSFILLSVALQTFPMGTAYAVWTGIGASGAAVLGMLFYNEARNMKRIFFLFLIIFAIVGLKLSA